MSAGRQRPLTFMDVAKKMIFWLHSGLDSIKELHTARPDPCTAEVPMSDRRCVGDEDICVFRNCVPLLQTWFTSWHIEGPVAELWLPVVRVKCQRLGVSDDDGDCDLTDHSSAAG